MKKTLSFWKFIFIVYVLGLLWFVVIKPNGMTSRMESILEHRNQGHWNYNLVPFRSIFDYMEMNLFHSSVSFKNLIGNIAAFVPLGFLIPAISTRLRKISKALLVCLICIIGIEIFQFVAMIGYFDVDDIILNMLGCFMGYLVYSGFRLVVDAYASKRKERISRGLEKQRL